MVLPEPNGPGTILAKRLSKLGVARCSPCEELARTMDFLGTDGCREHFEELVEQIYENGVKNPSLLGAVVRWLPESPVKVGIRKVVEDAIEEWEEEDGP